MSVIPGKLNFQNSPLYDTAEIAGSAATGSKIVFFQNPTGSTKGKNLTNMTRGYELTNPENFTVAAMRFVALGVDIADMLSLMKNYAASLIISGKVMLEAPIDFFAGGGGLVIATEASGAGTVEYAQNGVADPRAVAMIPSAVQPKIESGETFSVELNGTSFTAGAAIFLRCYLDGVFGRAVG